MIDVNINWDTAKISNKKLVVEAVLPNNKKIMLEFHLENVAQIFKKE